MMVAAFEVGDTLVASVTRRELEAAAAAELLELVGRAVRAGKLSFVVDVGTELTPLALTTLFRIGQMVGPEGTVKVWGLDAESDAVLSAVGMTAIEVYDDWAMALAS